MKWLWITLFIMIIPGASPVIQNILAEPAIKYMKRWEPHRSLGVVVTYDTSQGVVQYAHPVMSFMDAHECKEILQDDNVWNLMTFGDRPVRYFVASFATAYRFPPGEWESVIVKTRPYE